MDRLDRLDAMVRMLADRPGIAAADLALSLRTSIRSVFRDLARLRERGYPIEGGRGRGGGLRLHPNWGAGRVLLAGDEALGVLVALATVDRLELPLFGTDLARARRKLIDAFPPGIRRQLAPLRERILIGPPASAAVVRSYGKPQPAATRALQSAFVQNRLVDAEYRKHTGERSRRRVAPHALLLNWPAWYLLGHDFLRGEVRTFRLDRLTAVRVEPETFRPHPRAVLAAIEGLEDASHVQWSL